MKQFLIFMVSLAVAMASLTGCGESKASDREKLFVVTTIFPQYDFSRQIAGEYADVKMLLRPGAESHSYEPTPQDIRAIESCDLFLYTGGENDVWVEKILDSMGDKRPDTLRLVDCVPTVAEEITEGMEHEHEHRHHHHHENIVEGDIKDRPLADFAGSFRSVQPVFAGGALDWYIEEEAQAHETTFDAMKQSFLQKKSTEFDEIKIEGDTVFLKQDNELLSAEYAYIGFRTVCSEDGDIESVWYVYEKKEPDEKTPRYLLLNDHRVDSKPHAEHDNEPAHVHLRYGEEDIDAILRSEEWDPTFFDFDATAEDISDLIASHVHHKDEDSHEHEHEEEIDEHVWTSPKNAEKIVEKISALLCEKDKAHAAVYQKNTEQYLAKLQELDSQLRDVTEHAKRKTVLFGDRFPFRYLAEEYGLTYYAAFSGCSGESEASAGTIAFLIDKVKEEEIPVVLTIELSNGKLADTICEATGAKKAMLHSCHNLTRDEQQAGETYLSLMEKNLEVLRAALS